MTKQKQTELSAFTVGKDELVEALEVFLCDDKIDCALGGNPNYVQERINFAKQTLTKAKGGNYE